jgi:hypothetical protein
MNDERHKRRLTMKKAIFIAAAFLLLAPGLSVQSEAARVDINIALPPVVFSSPPPLVVIPGTYAYFAPGVDADVLFYQGYWYRPHEGRWFRARGYNGPWASVAIERVPPVLLELPPDYRHVWRERPHIPYGDFNRNWKRWEKDRYWEKDRQWMDERRAMEHRHEEPRHGEHRYGEPEHEHGRDEHGHGSYEERRMEDTGPTLTPHVNEAPRNRTHE